VAHDPSASRTAGSRRAAVGDDHWLSRSYRDEPPPSRGARAMKRAARLGSPVVALACFLFFLRGIDRYTARCKQLCLDGAFRTAREDEAAGWTLYEGAWQWDAQQIVVALALAAAVLGLWSAVQHRWRRSVTASAVALALAAVWLAWVLQTPTPRDEVGRGGPPPEAVAAERAEARRSL
jgi:hypothetical protein